ncbi:hypothetical protein ACLOJK_018185 [Asimina triloba]
MPLFYYIKKANVVVKGSVFESSKIEALRARLSISSLAERHETLNAIGGTDREHRELQKADVGADSHSVEKISGLRSLSGVGRGTEAWVNLEDVDMAKLQQNNELLRFASFPPIS